jgi:FkbM family methyltransferase
MRVDLLGSSTHVSVRQHPVRPYHRHDMASYASQVLRRLRTRALRWRYGPRVRIAPRRDLIRLGSAYGGWWLADSRALQGATVVSAGLGEDASFDVEFAARFDARVVVVDPTPRAVAHFAGIYDRVGQGRSVTYTSDGCLPVESYDLSAIRPEQLTLVPTALSDQTGTAAFYAPPDRRHVSHSLVNFQNDYASDGEHIRVETLAVDELLASLDAEVPLVKLDIEGSEIEVINRMLERGFHPDQVLVEFDELNRPSARSRSRFEEAHRSLLAHGYEVAHFDGRSNFLYLRTVTEPPARDPG